MQSDRLKSALKICAALWIGGVVVSEVWSRSQPGSFDAMNLRGIADIFAGLAIVLAVVVAIRTAWRGGESGQAVNDRSQMGLLDRPWKRLALVLISIPVGAFVIALAVSGYYYTQLRFGGDDYMLNTCHREMAWRDLGLKSDPPLLVGVGTQINPDFTRVTELANERHNRRWLPEVAAIEERIAFKSCMARGRNNLGLNWALDHAANIALWTAGLLLAFFVGRAVLRALLGLSRWIMMRDGT